MHASALRLASAMCGCALPAGRGVLFQIHQNVTYARRFTSALCTAPQHGAAQVWLRPGALHLHLALLYTAFSLLPAGRGVLPRVHQVRARQGAAEAHVGPGGGQCGQPGRAAVPQVHVPHGRLQEGSGAACCTAARALAAGGRCAALRACSLCWAAVDCAWCGLLAVLVGGTGLAALGVPA